MKSLKKKNQRNCWLCTTHRGQPIQNNNNNSFSFSDGLCHCTSQWLLCAVLCEPVNCAVSIILIPLLFGTGINKGDLQTICRFSYMKVYKLITLRTKFKNLLSLGGKITMFSKFITNYTEQGWWHSSLSLKCMHLQLKEVNNRGRHA